MKTTKIAVRFAAAALCVMMLFSGCESGTEVPTPPLDHLGVTMVWIPTNGGKKYHKDADCSNMKNPQHVSLEYAKAEGYTACKKCYG